MGCTTDIELKGITLDCNDIPTGGLKAIYISTACDTALGFVDKPELSGGGDNPDYGKVVCCGFAPSQGDPEIGEVYSMEFNRKDGISGFVENKTVDTSGLTTNVPTLTVEFPKMTREKRQLLNDLLNPNVTLLIFVETAAGTKHCLGAKFGMRASSAEGATGTGRTEKNVYTVTFVGEESELSYDASDVWSNIENRVAVDTTGATMVDWRDVVSGGSDDREATVPRQDCIPVPTV